MASFTVTPPKSETDHQTADAHLKARIRATAGPHKLGVTFLKNPSSLLETKRQPYQAHYNMHRHPRISPALYQVSITGPVCTPRGTATRPAAAGSSSASRRDRATKKPVPGASSPRSCAGPIGGRSPTRTSQKPMEFYRQARAEGDFDAGIEMALSAVLVNPQFLFRIEPDPPGVAPSSAYRIPDVQLASRLSFFLWSSIPDDELLDLAERGELQQARGARTAGPADAGRPAVAEPGDQLRGPVAAPAQPGFDHAGPAPVPRLRRQPAAGLPAGDGAPVRGASCARIAACSTC